MKSSNSPRVLVVSDQHTSWTRQERSEEARYHNGVEAWVFAFENATYSGYRQAFALDSADFDIIIANAHYKYGNRLLQALAAWGESCKAHTKFVTLMEGDALHHIAPTLDFTRLFSASALVNCINPHARDFYQRLTTTRVETLGCPYPVDAVRAQRVPVHKRKWEIFACGNPLARTQDTLCAAVIARGHAMHYYACAPKFSRHLASVLRHRTLSKTYFLDKAKRLQTQYARHLQEDAERSIFEIRPMTELHEFHSAHAHTYMWVNLDERYTWARYVLDAAALAMPIITTASTAHGATLFPDTTVATPFSLEHAVQIADRLVREKEFYRTVCEYADERIEQFTHSALRRRLMELLYTK